MGERMGEILTFRCFNADKPRLGLVQTFSSRKGSTWGIETLLLKRAAEVPRKKEVEKGEW